MGKIRDFFYLLVIAVLISLSIIFIGAAFREEYPLWKNQKILEDLRSDVKAEETGDEDPGIDWEKLKKINPDIKKKYPIFMPACEDGVFPGIIVRCFKSTGGICTAKIPNHCCA